MFDDLLSEATKWAYRNIRTPGRYKYDKSKGEEDIEDYNKQCREQVEKRIKLLHDRGLQFPIE